MLARQIAFLSLGSFILGTAVGYFFRPVLAPPAHSRAPVTSVPPVAPEADPSGSSIAKTRPASAPLASESATPRNPLRERLQSLRWQRSVGASPNVLPFIGNEVNPQFAAILDLSEAQAARLRAAAMTAQQQIDQLRNLRATSHFSSDHKQLIVDLPGLDPAASRSIYDQFNAQLSATLDPDRLALATEIAGENMERLFDRFGLNAIRYELTLESSATLNGSPIFEYKRSFVDVAGGNGWGTSNTTLEQMRKSDPSLARFFDLAAAEAGEH